MLFRSNLFETSSKSFLGHSISEIFQDEVLDAAIDYARENHSSYTENDLRIGAFGRSKLLLSCTANPVELDGWVEGWRGLLLEFRHIEQQMKIARDRGFAIREHSLYLYAECTKAECPHRDDRPEDRPEAQP